MHYDMMDDTPLNIIKRPSLGTLGRRINVRTNFFEVLQLPKDDIIHYDITIKPKVSPGLNWKVFDELVRRNSADHFRDSLPVYDGRNNMFSHKELPIRNDLDVFTTDVQLTDPGQPPRNFRITIKRVNNIRMDDLVKFLNGRGRKPEAAIMALDVLIRHQPSIKYVTAGRSFFTPKGSQPLPEGLEAWRGYYQSARPTRGRMMINIDLSATAFYESGSLVQMVTKILCRRTPDDLRRGYSEKEMQKVERQIKGLGIRDNHRGIIRQPFKIIRLTSTPASHTKFIVNGNSVTVADYFLNQYQIRLNHAHLPCVVAKGSRGEIFLPMEVCDILKEKRCMRKLNQKQIDGMTKFACHSPNARINAIREGLETLNYKNNAYLRKFGMTISDEMKVVPARVLEAPTIQYHSSSAKLQPQDGAWNLRDKKVAAGATLGSWSVVVFLSETDLQEQVVRGFIRELVDTSQRTGMNIPNKIPPILYGNPLGDIESKLKEAWLKAGNVAQATPQLIACILPNTGPDLYGEIKRVSEVVIGVATQCIQRVHTLRPKKQYCANVCLKMNVKLGGMNSFLDPHDLPFISERPTIIFGADMTHPPPDESEKPSIAALCASLDARASRYAASIKIQFNRTDIIADMADMVKELLKTFYKTCGSKPERILFYRDGISESQFVESLKVEVGAIKAACQQLDENYRPTITFTVVQKRHHTRFFPMDRNNVDKSGNCLPGTVVETDITHPFEFDYYLQSHAGIIGTSRPAHYHVLYDENGFDADKHQALSYNLCYLYARCTRSVSLVPAVYYADLVCARARIHLKNWNFTEKIEVKEELRRVMYFM